MRTPYLICAVACVLSGCASYRAQPLDPAGVAAGISARALEPEKARSVLARVAPETPWDGKSWNRLSFLAFALANNPTIAEARANALSAAKAARASRIPPPATLTLTGEYANDPSTSEHWLYGIASDIPLDVGGARTQRVGSAVFAARAARYDYMEAIWATRMSLRRALAEVLLSSQELQLTTELSAVRTRQLSGAEGRAAAGEMARADLERVRADANADFRKATDAQARLTGARGALAQVLGVQIAALDGPVIDWPEFEGASAPPLTAETRQAALRDRADILRALAGYDQAEANLRGEVGKQFPDIHVGPGYTWERGLVKLPFSLGLVLPPIDLNRATIKAAEAQRAASGAHLEAIVGSALAEIDGASAEQMAAQAALAKVAASDKPGAQLLGRQADNMLKLGEIDIVDWGAAKAGALQSELTALEALRRAHAANAALEQALRRPLEGPELAMRATALEDLRQ